MKTLTSHSRTLAVSLGALAVLASGCANMTEAQRSAAIGGGLGALAGAAIGDSRGAAAVGAGVGALGGYIWSTQMAQKKAAMERATAGTGVAVTQTADNQQMFYRRKITRRIMIRRAPAPIYMSISIALPILGEFASAHAMRLI